ncbi:MAG: ribonuclease III [Bdellovibrionota bacterium]
MSSALPRETRAKIESALGYKFRSAAHLLTALTHRSYRHEQAQKGAGNAPEANERLEFLGDAVLDLVVTAALVDRFPTKTEGELSKIRAGLVQEKTLARIAQELDLGPFVLLGEAEAKAGGRKKPSILADLYEALIGAIYLDSNYAKTQTVVLRHFDSRLESNSLMRRVADYKTRLQEITQERWKRPPEYRLREATGPDHRKIFEVECVLNGKVLGEGRAGSKKEASQKAARAALQFLRKEPSEVLSEKTA